MSKDRIFDQPMTELILSMSAWRRLRAKAAELKENNNVLGPILLIYMDEAWSEAEKNLKDNEKSLMKQMKEAME